MRRVFGIAFGIGNHLLFAFVVWQLFWFLKGPEPPRQSDGGLAVDALLSLLFTVPHSLLLLPAVRRRVTQIVPDAFYGSLFCIATCSSLLVVISNWRPSAAVFWQFTGVPGALVQAAFFGSWIVLFYSLHLTGLGYQTGWTPWWHWLRNRKLPSRKFAPRGAYLKLRHPVYLSFLGLIWFTPVVTADRAVLIAVWSTYVFVGSWLKDCRLIFYLGDRYRAYQSEVPGYPGVLFGPLARIPFETANRPKIVCSSDRDFISSAVRKAA